MIQSQIPNDGFYFGGSLKVKDDDVVTVLSHGKVRTIERKTKKGGSEEV